MEDLYMNITSQNNSYDRNIIHDDFDDYYDYYDYYYYYDIRYMVTYIVISIGLPLTLVAIYALCSQVRNDHVAPIYVINLLISDIIQFCCMIIWVALGDRETIGNITYLSTLMASVCFMVCIALERYLVIAHPLWYRFRRSIKSSVLVCVLVWVLVCVLPFVCVFVFVVRHDDNILINIFSIVLLLPLPLFIFFLGGTLKALSTIRVPSDEKRRIVGILVLVLLIYALLFLPGTIFLLSKGKLIGITLNTPSLIFLRLSPLADLTLYIFMRKGIIDKLLSSVCCCRMDSDDTNSSSV